MNGKVEVIESQVPSTHVKWSAQAQERLVRGIPGTTQEDIVNSRGKVPPDALQRPFFEQAGTTPQPEK
jgi:hypothetical protein